MRWLMIFAVISASLLLGISCHDNGPDPPPDDPIKISDPASFFQVAEGNIWSYNNGVEVRELDGDTVINGVTCARLLKAGATSEAWTVDAAGFYQHLLDGQIWFDPPLAIPFSLEKDKPYAISSIARQLGDTTALASLTGTLTFTGYVSRMVMEYDYDSLVHLEYQTTIYNFADDVSKQDDFEEYWARNIGLVFSPDSDPTDGINDELSLDSALIDGVWLPVR
ncbi:MAG: hypothetical protein ABIJ61_09380 [bacterium]